MSYKCEILADSIGPQGNRLTTFKVTYPRIIHAEMCRHRILSRNTASSRAIPFAKMAKDVQENPFIPLAFQRDHKGMQGSGYIIPIDNIYGVKDTWLAARDKAVELATSFNKQGVTKQLCNRLLEPFVWTTELISGTEWDNFFERRCPIYDTDYGIFKSKNDVLKADVANYNDVATFNQNKPNKLSYSNLSDLDWLSINVSQAEIHIQKIAEMMWDELNLSVPKVLKSGEWHIPYGEISMSILEQQELSLKFPTIKSKEDLKCRIATARAARISYTTLGDNPKIDYEADIKLHDRLLKDKHPSPFEHCARVMSDDEYESFYIGEGANRGHTGLDKNKGWCNNFRGFINYRYLIENK